MRRSVLVMLLASLMVVATGASAAFAGEWARGPDGGHTTPVKEYRAASICSFNGADEPDTTEDHGEGPGDDDTWAATPAGFHSAPGSQGVVQAGGQFVAMFASMYGPGAVAEAVAAGDFRGFGGDCNPKG